jgi:alpha-mannosidase
VPTLAPFKIEGHRVVSTSLKQPEDGRGYLVRLYNPGETPDAVRIMGRRGVPIQVRLSDVHERILDPVEGPIRLRPYEILTLRVLPNDR